MAPSIGYNPMVTSNASGSFNIESTGYIQGQALDSPNARFDLSSGVLALSETLPMWGGVGIFENIPAGGVGAPGAVLGGQVGRATQIAQGAGQLTGFSVFDQAHHMVQTPQSEVPVSLQGMSVHFYRFGDGARIAVACDPSLIDLQGNIITSQVSWDFGGQQLAKGTAAYPANVVTAVAWANGIATYTTTTAHTVPVGELVTISGFTPAGFNGTFETLAGTAGETIVVAIPVNPGAATVEGQLNAGGGIIPVRIREILPTGNMTVQFNPATGFATFNRNGAIAVIEI
jgi:hypothetical protein